MSDLTPEREALAAIAASLRAYLEMQEDTGAWGIPRGRGADAAPSDARSTPTAPQGHLAADAPARDAHAAANEVRYEPPATHAAAAHAAATHAAAAPPPDRDAAPIALDAAASSPAVHADAPAAAPEVPTSPEARGARLAVLGTEVAGCTRCGLAATRTNTVFARGNPSAALCFVGEAPGADEDAQGLPFVGRAGQLLDRMIGAMGLAPERDVYVCNILKCRPPDNRRPTPEESSTCIPYLHEQLALVRPKVIVALGNTAVAALLHTTMGITKVRGQWKLYKGTTLVMPTYHPSYLLRPSPQQQEAKRQAWEDLQLVMKELGLPNPRARG